MKVGIIGATGYTGFELIKILGKHRQFEISVLTSDTSAGAKISDLYPVLKSVVDHELVANNFESIAALCDAVFLCLPHAASQEAAAFFYQKGKIVIDLSADFRIDDQSLYENTYGVGHHYPDLLETAVYGLPELYREKVKTSRLIANPGCYPTSVILPLYPLLQNGLINESFIIADSKSGVSGAGKKASEKTHYCEVNEDFKPYGILTHRHNPEINHILKKSGQRDVDVLFTPHLLPLHRGIESTVYFETDAHIDQLRQCLSEAYANEPFVRLFGADEVPSIKGVANTNFADIGIYQKGSKVVVVSCIDNLIKGASGQAVHNLNIIAGINETEGLL